MNNGRPESIPTCEHGKNAYQGCAECKALANTIKAEIQCLSDEFWGERGKADLETLFYRAYRMGMKSGKL